MRKTCKHIDLRKYERVILMEKNIAEEVYILTKLFLVIGTQIVFILQ